MYLGECRDLGVPDPARPTSTPASWRSPVENGRRALRPRAPSRTSARARSSRCSRVRKELGRIDSLYTLCEQVDQRLVNKRPLESLVEGRRVRLARAAAGAVPSRRARLFAAVDKAIEHGSRHQRDRRTRATSQLLRRAATRARDRRAIPLPGRRAVDRDAAARVREGSARPLHERPSARALHRGAEDLRRAAHRASSPARSPTSGSAASSAACARSRRRRATAWRSSCSTTSPAASRSSSFRRPSASTAILIAADAMLLVRGKFEKDEESARLVATELQPISLLRERTTREVVIHLTGLAGRNTMRGARGAAVAASRRPPRLAGARREATTATSRCASAPTSRSACDRPKAGRGSGTAVRSRIGRPAVWRWQCR